MTRGKVTGWNYFWEAAQLCYQSETKGRVHVLRRRPRARAEPDAVHRRSGQVDKLIVRNRRRNSPVACELFFILFFFFAFLYFTSLILSIYSESNMSMNEKKTFISITE